MKLIKKQLLYNLLIMSMICLVSLPVFSLQSDSNQLVAINALKQFLDMQKNFSTFTYNVVITQGSIYIHADKAIIVHPDGDKNKIYIEAFGNPVTFNQMLDDGKSVTGHAKKVHYNVETQFVSLTGNACLEQFDSNIKGDHITYLIKTQQMQAFSDKGNRVTTVLVPSQLQEKHR